jgi:hypothetical protein
VRAVAFIDGDKAAALAFDAKDLPAGFQPRTVKMAGDVVVASAAAWRSACDRLRLPAHVAPAAWLAFAAGRGFARVVPAGRALRAFALPFDPPGQTLSARLLPDRIGLLRRSLTELASFTAAANADPYVVTAKIFITTCLE